MIRFRFRQKNQRFLQAVCRVTVASFLFSIAAPPFAQSSLWTERKKNIEEIESSKNDFKKTADLSVPSAPNEPFRIPAQLGRVIESFQGDPARPWIIHIQDAHGYVEAQRHLAGILRALSQQLPSENGLLTGVEGAWKTLDLNWLKVFPDKKVLEAATEDLLKRVVITGEESVSILEGTRTVAIEGIEDQEIYLKHLQVKSEIEKVRQQALSRGQISIAGIQKAIDELQPAIYSRKLLNYDEVRSAFESNRIPLFGYLSFLSSQWPRIWEEAGVPSLKLAVDLSGIERNLDLAAVSKERENFLVALTQILEPALAPQIAAYSLRFKSGQMPAAQYHKILLKLGQIHDVPLRHLTGYQNYLEKVENMNLERVKKDLNFLELEIENRELDPRARELLAADRWVRVQEKIWNLQATREDWASYKNDSGMSWRRVRQILEHSGELKGSHQTLALKGWKDFVEVMEQNSSRVKNYYSLAFQRDQLMVEKTLQIAREKQAKHAVLIAGGFHSAGITGLLKERGVSFVVIRPELSEFIALNKESLMSSISHPGTLRAQSVFTSDLTEISVEAMVGLFGFSALFDRDVVKLFGQYREQLSPEERKRLFENIVISDPFKKGELTCLIVGIKRGTFSGQDDFDILLLSSREGRFERISDREEISRILFDGHNGILERENWGFSYCENGEFRRGIPDWASFDFGSRVVKGESRDSPEVAFEKPKAWWRTTSIVGSSPNGLPNGNHRRAASSPRFRPLFATVAGAWSYLVSAGTWEVEQFVLDRKISSKHGTEVVEFLDKAEIGSSLREEVSRIILVNGGHWDTDAVVGLINILQQPRFSDEFVEVIRTKSKTDDDVPEKVKNIAFYLRQVKWRNSPEMKPEDAANLVQLQRSIALLTDELNPSFYFQPELEIGRRPYQVPRQDMMYWYNWLNVAATKALEVKAVFFDLDETLTDNGAVLQGKNLDLLVELLEKNIDVFILTAQPESEDLVRRLSSLSKKIVERKLEQRFYLLTGSGEVVHQLDRSGNFSKMNEQRLSWQDERAFEILNRPENARLIEELNQFLRLQPSGPQNIEDAVRAGKLAESIYLKIKRDIVDKVKAEQGDRGIHFRQKEKDPYGGLLTFETVTKKDLRFITSELVTAINTHPFAHLIQTLPVVKTGGSRDIGISLIDKADSIAQICEERGIPYESVLFFDDSMARNGSGRKARKIVKTVWVEYGPEETGSYLENLLYGNGTKAGILPFVPATARSASELVEQGSLDAIRLKVRTLKDQLSSSDDQERSRALREVTELANSPYEEVVYAELEYPTEPMDLDQKLDEYRRIEGDERVDRVLLLAQEARRQNVDIVFQNATYKGGGVAEMYQTGISFLKALGVNVHWHIIWVSAQKFYDLTKLIHNSIQGIKSAETGINWERRFEIYRKIMDENWALFKNRFKGKPGKKLVVFVDDPQPAGLVEKIKAANPNAIVSWRSHIDTSGTRSGGLGVAPWNILSRYIEKANLVLRQPGHPPRNGVHPLNLQIQLDMPPGVDTAAPKNQPRSKAQARRNIEQKGIRDDHDQHRAPKLDAKGLKIAFAARADPAKGQIFQLVAFRQYLDQNPEEDAVLWFFVQFADDDPEGRGQYEYLKEMVIKLGLTDHVQIFTNLGEELADFASFADAHSILSTREGRNMVMDEFGLHGVPVIANTIPALRERVELGGYPVELPLSIEEMTPSEFVAAYESDHHEAVNYVNDLVRAMGEIKNNPVEAKRRAEKLRKWVLQYETILVQMSWYLALAVAQPEDLDGASSAREVEERIVERLRQGGQKISRNGKVRQALVNFAPFVPVFLLAVDLIYRQSFSSDLYSLGGIAFLPWIKNIPAGPSLLPKIVRSITGFAGKLGSVKSTLAVPARYAGDWISTETEFVADLQRLFVRRKSFFDWLRNMKTDFVAQFKLEIVKAFRMPVKLEVLKSPKNKGLSILHDLAATGLVPFFHSRKAAVVQTENEGLTIRMDEPTLNGLSEGTSWDRARVRGELARFRLRRVLGLLLGPKVWLENLKADPAVSALGSRLNSPAVSLEAGNQAIVSRVLETIRQNNLEESQTTILELTGFMVQPNGQISLTSGLRMILENLTAQPQNSGRNIFVYDSRKMRLDPVQAERLVRELFKERTGTQPLFIDLAKVSMGELQSRLNGFRTQVITTVEEQTKWEWINRNNTFTLVAFQRTSKGIEFTISGSGMEEWKSQLGFGEIQEEDGKIRFLLDPIENQDLDFWKVEKIIETQA